MQDFSIYHYGKGPNTLSAWCYEKFLEDFSSPFYFIHSLSSTAELLLFQTSRFALLPSCSWRYSSKRVSNDVSTLYGNCSTLIFHPWGHISLLKSIHIEKIPPRIRMQIFAASKLLSIWNTFPSLISFIILQVTLHITHQITFFWKS